MNGKERKSVQRIDGTWVNRAEDVPYGYCHCGCGGRTNIAKSSSAKLGRVLGEPYKFIRGHGGGRGRVSPPLEDVFLRHVEKREVFECWEWQGSKLRSGYGRLTYGAVERLAHRIAYEFAHGAISEGEVVRHKCDNPPCCNPNHLEIGTPKDNAQDAVDRSRTAHGERNGQSVLTEDDVREARSKYAQGATITAIAQLYGVERSTMRSAIHRKTWRRVA